MNLLLLLFIFQVRGQKNDEGPHCVMYGECGKAQNAPAAQLLPCSYNGTAKVLSDKGIKVLKKWCPHYFDSTSDSQIIYTCCDEAQLETLDKNIQQAMMLISRCPSCKYNFVRHYCDFTCRPDQSNFIEPLRIVNATLNKSAGCELLDFYPKKKKKNLDKNGI